MEDILVIRDPEVAKLLADDTRRKILKLLTIGEFSAYQLARLLKKNTAAIDYHLRLLEKAGLIKHVRTEVRGNLVKKYYASVAKMYLVSYSLSGSEREKAKEVKKVFNEYLENVVRNLEIFDISLTPENRARIKFLLKEYLKFKEKTIEFLLSRKRDTITHAVGIRLLLDFLTTVFAFHEPTVHRLLKEGYRILESGGVKLEES